MTWPWSWPASEAGLDDFVGSAARYSDHDPDIGIDRDAGYYWNAPGGTVVYGHR